MAGVSTSSPISYETVASTLGIWVISFFLATILYGMGVLQAWLYFHWYPQDGWKLKSLVITVLILETVQVTTFFAATYDVIIKHFGDWAAVLAITWLHSTQLLAGYLSAFVVQMYFACTIYLCWWTRCHYIVVALMNPIVNGPGLQRWVFTIPIVLSAVVELAMALGQAIEITFLSSFTQIEKTTWIYSLLSACTFSCDLLIAFAIYVTLTGKRTAIQEIAGVQYFPSRSNTIIRKLIIYAINRGVMTAIAAAINLILFLAMPNTFYYFIGLLTSSKLYMNSMLAALNSRQYISQSSEDDAAHCWNSIPVQVLRSETRRSRAAASSIGENDETSIRDSKLGFSADSI
ncbi:hypothetical protein F5876DRAFT_76732 [Lentinula aff. lateritia]|uniref:Uncharacterized protein n=1 Tax=Lentinula aff. lateritia TaxID=2804960 RepID=A0ACC1U0X5_9AGAR|nr:hypothetical protein F5876DRAFT_76732 [Lentinula aff. lateritia]